jgi:hypothetical protein
MLEGGKMFPRLFESRDLNLILNYAKYGYRDFDSSVFQTGIISKFPFGDAVELTISGRIIYYQAQGAESFHRNKKHPDPDNPEGTWIRDSVFEENSLSNEAVLGLRFPSLSAKKFVPNFLFEVGTAKMEFEEITGGYAYPLYDKYPNFLNLQVDKTIEKIPVLNSVSIVGRLNYIFHPDYDEFYFNSASVDLQCYPAKWLTIKIGGFYSSPSPNIEKRNSEENPFYNEIGLAPSSGVNMGISIKFPGF